MHRIRGNHIHPEINEIRRKMLNSPWPQYLRSVAISGIRGWQGQEVRFEFPIVAIVGENGSGKSTVLQAAASAYSNPENPKNSFYPSYFFPATAWDTISGVSLDYKIRQGSDDKSYSIRKPSTKWKGLTQRPKRRVIWQDISRILPITATIGYARVAKQNSIEVSARPLSPDLTQQCTYILGRSYDSVRTARSNADARKDVNVAQWSGRQYSGFHQGAGESSMIDLLPLLQNAPNNSLILIDEIEASLHPRSQRRLIHFLLKLARVKCVQVILTTHSSCVLEELPEDARILLNHGTDEVEILYGVTPNYALNHMDDVSRPDLHLLTEDEESSALMKEILRQNSVDLSRIECVEVGPSNVVEVLGNLGERSRLPFRSLGVLDADKDEKPGCIKLPGELAPEIQIFKDILRDAVPQLSIRLGTNELNVKNALMHSMTITNHHNWLADLERRLSYSKSYLWETMCQVWVKECLPTTDAQPIVERIRNKL